MCVCVCVSFSPEEETDIKSENNACLRMCYEAARRTEATSCIAVVVLPIDPLRTACKSASLPRQCRASRWATFAQAPTSLGFNVPPG